MKPVFDREVAEYLGYQKYWPTRELVLVCTGITLGIPMLLALAIIFSL